MDLSQNRFPALLQIDRIAAGHPVISLVHLKQLDLISADIVKGHPSQHIIEDRITGHIFIDQILQPEFFQLMRQNPTVIHILFIQKQRFKLFDRHRAVIVIALAVDTAYISQEIHMLLFLHSLRDHAKLRQPCHADNGLQDSHTAVLAVLVHIQKLGIDLNDIHIHILQHVE